MLLFRDVLGLIAFLHVFEEVFPASHFLWAKALYGNILKLRVMKLGDVQFPKAAQEEELIESQILFLTVTIRERYHHYPHIIK